MSIKMGAKLFIVPPLRLAFYQQLLSSVSNIQELGDRLVRQAEQAQITRQLGQVKEAAYMLANHPMASYQAVGQYYLGWCEYRSGHTEQAQSTFERIAGKVAPSYDARITLSLAAVEASRRDYAAEMHYYLETLKASRSIVTSLEALRGIAIIKAKEGYHDKSAKDLEDLHALARHAPPHVYFDYLNSLAVELGDTGRFQEAMNISRLVSNSPLAPYYKEWQDTLAEVNQKAYKSRSTVHVVLPRRESKKRSKRAKILRFPTPRKESFLRPSLGPPTEEETKDAISRGLNLDPKQLLALIIKIVAQDRLPDSDIYKIVSVYYDALVTANE